MRRVALSITVLVASGFLCVAKTQAQEFTISGHVVDKSNHAIPLVSITIQRGDTIIKSALTDGSGKYSLSYPGGELLTAVAYASSEFLPSIIQNLSGSRNHSIDKVLVRNTETASLSRSEASEVTAALEFLADNLQLYSKTVEQYSESIKASRFPQELQNRVLGVQLSASLARVERAEERVAGSETRLSEAEQMSQKLAGQIDELAAVSNAARGGAKAAQQTADAATAGVSGTNDRITQIDDYQIADKWVVTFEEGSAELTSAGKTQLAALSKKIAGRKGYLLTIASYAGASRNSEQIMQLSQQMAESVARYLTGDQNIPLWRIAPPMGYVESRVASTSAASSVAPHNRVVVTLMTSRGLTESSPTTNPR